MIALDGETGQSNACDDLTKILFTVHVSCFPVGATIASINLQFLSPVESNMQNHPLFGPTHGLCPRLGRVAWHDYPEGSAQYEGRKMRLVDRGREEKARCILQ